MRGETRRLVAALFALALALVPGLVLGMSKTAYADELVTNATITSLVLNDDNKISNLGASYYWNHPSTVNQSLVILDKGRPDNWDQLRGKAPNINTDYQTSIAKTAAAFGANYYAFTPISSTSRYSTVSKTINLENATLESNKEYYIFLWTKNGSNYYGEDVVASFKISDNKVTYWGKDGTGDGIDVLFSYTVTYKVVNGTWSDDSTTDKKETVQHGSQPASVPTGMKASSGYTSGAWDTDPAAATITGATTFTHAFKQMATVTTAPTAKTLTYNGKEQELVTAGVAEGGAMQYSLDGERFSDEVPSATEARTYTVWYKVVGDENHVDTEPVSVAVTIEKADWTETEVYESAAAGTEGTVDLTGYIAPGGALGALTVSSGSQSEGYPQLVEKELKFMFDELAQGGAETIAKIAIPVTGATNYKDYSIIAEVSAPAKAHQTLAFAEKTVTRACGETFTITPTQGHEDGGYGEPYGEVTYTSSNPEVAVVDPSTGEVTAKSEGTARITARAARTDAIDAERPGYLPAVAGYTLNVEKVFPTAAAPTGLTATYGETLADVELYNPEGNTAGTWTWAVDGATAVGDAGERTFKATFTPDDTTTYCVVEGVDVTVTVEKADSRPAAVSANDRTYDGAERPLVIVEGAAEGGTMQYSLDGTSFSDEVPSATEAGTYDVWYKVVGDANHNDTEAQKVTSTIKKKDETKPDTKPATYTVTLTGGSNAAADGATEQTVEQGKAMATVTYVANEGFHFDAFDPVKSNGVVAAFRDGNVVVSGTPTADVRLTVPDAVADPVPGEPRVTYAGHVQGTGDLLAVKDGETLGTTGESRRLEQFSASVSGIEGASISYRAHLQRTGWTAWEADGAKCGTTGEARRLEAVQMRLSGADGYHVWYRVHSQTYGWLGWARDGQPAGTAGQSKRGEALEVQVLPEGEAPEGYIDGQASYVGAATADVHLQGTGWTDARSATSFGTTGESRRLEAVGLSLENQPAAGGVEYDVHLQTRGWEDGFADGQVAGTVGESRRLEAVRIRLNGEMATSGQFSVWYRVHTQTYGWLGWAKDGQEAGTTGLSKRGEALEVQILPSGQVPNDYDAGLAASIDG